MTRDMKILLAICGASLVLRVGFVLWYPQVPVVSDAAVYNEQAYRAAFMQGDAPVFSKGPGYPVFLSSIYRTVGYRHNAVRLAQALLSVLTVLLIYRLAEAIFDRQVARGAGLLAALYPAFTSYTGWLLTETLATALLLLFIYWLVLAAQGKGRMWWIASGVAAGLLMITRQEMAPVVGACVLVAGWRRGSRRWVGLLACAAALVILPWTMRNYQMFRRIVLVAPGAGQQLWISTVEFQGAEWDLDAETGKRYHELVDGFSPVEADQRLRRAALAAILDKPLTYMKLCIGRIPRLWLGGHSNTFAGLEQGVGVYFSQGQYLLVVVKLSMFALNMALMLLAGVGGWVAIRLGSADPRLVFCLAAPIAVKAIVHTFLFAVLRYQVVIMPFIIIFAAFALSHVRRVVSDLSPAHS